MLHATLYGAPGCRRYRRLKRRLAEAAAASSIPLTLEEIHDPAALAQFSPLTLPRLYVEGHLVASRNVPSAASLRRLLKAQNRA